MGRPEHPHPPPGVQHSAASLSGVHTCVCLRPPHGPPRSATIPQAQSPRAGGGVREATGPPSLTGTSMGKTMRSQALLEGVSLFRSARLTRAHSSEAANSFCRSRTTERRQKNAGGCAGRHCRHSPRPMRQVPISKCILATSTVSLGVLFCFGSTSPLFPSPGLWNTGSIQNTLERAEAENTGTES